MNITDLPKIEFLLQEKWTRYGKRYRILAPWGDQSPEFETEQELKDWFKSSHNMTDNT